MQKVVLMSLLRSLTEHGAGRAINMALRTELPLGMEICSALAATTSRWRC